MNKSNMFGFDKASYLSDSEIESLYTKKSKLTRDKNIQKMLFRASMYDPRRSDKSGGNSQEPKSDDGAEIFIQPLFL
jgi:hypothetical protein